MINFIISAVNSLIRRRETVILKRYKDCPCPVIPNRGNVFIMAKKMYLVRDYTTGLERWVQKTFFFLQNYYADWNPIWQDTIWKGGLLVLCDSSGSALSTWGQEIFLWILVFSATFSFLNFTAKFGRISLGSIEIRPITWCSVRLRCDRSHSLGAQTTPRACGATPYSGSRSLHSVFFGIRGVEPCRGATRFFRDCVKWRTIIRIWAWRAWATARRRHKEYHRKVDVVTRCSAYVPHLTWP